jgi:hypothetical protein
LERGKSANPQAMDGAGSEFGGDDEHRLGSGVEVSGRRSDRAGRVGFGFADGGHRMGHRGRQGRGVVGGLRLLGRRGWARIGA